MIDNSAVAWRQSSIACFWVVAFAQTRSFRLRDDVIYVIDKPIMAEYLASIFGTEKDK